MGKRIWHCHGVGHKCGSDSIPGPGNFICPGCSHKKKIIKKLLFGHISFKFYSLFWRYKEVEELEFPGGLVVKDLTLSLLWVGSLLWHVFNP